LDALALDPTRSVYQYNCRTWNRENGLPVNAVRALAQTTDGYIWLGTQQGLIRFDGMNFESISLPNRPQFRLGAVDCLASSREGGLWFGIEGGSLGLYDSNDFHSMERFSWVDPAMRVGVIRETSDGWLWAGAGEGAGRCLPGTTNGSAFLGQLGAVSAIHEDAHHRVWLGTSDDGLFYWQSGRLNRFPDQDLRTKAIFGVTTDSHEHLWVATQAGVYCYDSNFLRHDLVSTFSEVKALLTDRHGVVWIGTSDGLIRYREGEVSNLKLADGLAHNFVTSLLEDEEGSLWVGTKDGLSQLSDVKLPIYSSAEGMLEGSCHGLCASTNGGIWIATTEGLSRFDGLRFTNLSQQIGLTNAYVKRVFEASNGDVYFINADRSGDRDVDVLSAGKMVACYHNKNWPLAIGEDAKGVVAAVGGSLFRVNRTQFIPFDYRGGKVPDLRWVRNLYGCADGSLLVATVNGLFRIKDGVIENWAMGDGLSDFDVLWACSDADGTIWAGMKSGVARIRGREVRNLNQSAGLADDYICSIVPDKIGNLWMFSTKGFMRASLSSLNDYADGKTNHVDCVVYNGLEAVKSIDTADIEYVGCRSTDGRIWFPTPSGAVMIDPAHILENWVPPPVHIDQVRVNGAPQTGPSAAPAHPGRGELVIEYTGLSYIAPQKVRFRYQLKGYDAEWIDGGNRRSVFYANLKPRHYTFVVQACNADGVWSTASDQFDINVPPHYYQTAWFNALAGLLGLAAIGGGFWWRVRLIAQKQRKLQHANEVLESKIRERTGELADQRNLLRTLIDHLPDGIFVKDTQSRVLIDNVAHARLLGLKDPAEAVGKTDLDCLPREQAEQFRTAEQDLIATGRKYEAEEKVTDARTGETRWMRTTKVALHDSSGKITGFAGINRDITDRKKWEAEMESLHRKLVEASRHAGMEEVATSVLHNVGNVLNSVSVSSTLVSQRLRHLNVINLTKAVQLMQAHAGDLGNFLTVDPKGRHLPLYLEKLSDHLCQEQESLQAELKGLAENVEHIKEIVAMQQTYAKVSGVSEIVRAADLAEDALRMHRDAFQRHGVRVIREFSEVPQFTMDRHKVIQILVNLLQNARHACEQNGPGDHQVVVRIRPAGPASIRFEVTDNGVGIPFENLTRIFAHGFTTRKDGHGFGLHSGALAARELGGSLTAFSEGPGKGATFTLELPIETKPAQPQSGDMPPGDQPEYHPAPLETAEALGQTHS
jgi:PAS domain S-box-containing protein